MNPMVPMEKKRKKLKTSAVTAVIVGIFAIVNLIIIFFKYGYLFPLIVERYPDTKWFVITFKILAFGLCPLLCLFLIGLGWSVLRYLKKEHD